MSKYSRVAVAGLAAAVMVSFSHAQSPMSLQQQIAAGARPEAVSTKTGPGPGLVVRSGGGGSRGSATFYSDQATFEAAHPGLPVEDFEDGNVPPGNIFGCPDACHAGIDDGTCYDAGDWSPGLWAESNPVLHPTDGIAGINTVLGYPNQAILANWNVEDLTLRFPAGDVTAVGFDLISFLNVRPHDITVFDTTGQVIGSVTVTPTPPAATFVGVDVVGCNIGAIRIVEPTGVNFEGVDNVQYDGRRFVEATDPREPLIGLDLDIFSAGGVPGNLGLNVVTSVDGSPFFYILLPKFNYNASGVRLQTGTLPADTNLIGHSFGFTCFSSRDPGNSGPVIATNEHVVTLN